MLTKIFEFAMRISPRLSRAMIRFWYQMLVVIDRQREITFMNYGYANLDPGANGLALNDAERDNRYCIQLYHHVAAAVDLTAKDVLEVGSGRGAAPSYLPPSFNPPPPHPTILP